MPTASPKPSSKPHSGQTRHSSGCGRGASLRASSLLRSIRMSLPYRPIASCVWRSGSVAPEPRKPADRRDSPDYGRSLACMQRRHPTLPLAATAPRCSSSPTRPRDRKAGVGLTSRWLSRRKAPESPTGWLPPADMPTLHSVVFCLHLESIRPFGRRPCEGPVHALTQGVTRRSPLKCSGTWSEPSRTPNPAVPLPVSSRRQATLDATARSPELLGPMCGNAAGRPESASSSCSRRIR